VGLHKGIFINDQLVMGQENEHVGERYTLSALVRKDRLVVETAEELATSANGFIVNS
jgi:hypothetical protein